MEDDKVLECGKAVYAEFVRVQRRNAVCQWAHILTGYGPTHLLYLMVKIDGRVIPIGCVAIASLLKLANGDRSEEAEITQQLAILP